MKELIIEAIVENDGERIDKFISDRVSDISRSYAAKLCDDGNVFVNEKAVGKNHRLKGTQNIVKLYVPEPESIEILPENIPLNIVYEDNDLIVIDKPRGMVVHPAPGNYKGTLVNALMYHCGDSLSAINGVVRPGIVHRIDKDTSGLLVAAKNNLAHIKLSEQLKQRKAQRVYTALVNGNIKEEEGTINKPLGRNPSDRKKIAVVKNGREAVTHFKVIERFGRYTLVECALETGRTHQIRVHMASIGHSIVGDKAYGIKKEAFNLDGQLLHARALGFEHPVTGEVMEFNSPLPEYFENVLSKLR